jgi:hypothetical protein
MSEMSRWNERVLRESLEDERECERVHPNACQTEGTRLTIPRGPFHEPMVRTLCGPCYEVVQEFILDEKMREI